MQLPNGSMKQMQPHRLRPKEFSFFKIAQAGGQTWIFQFSFIFSLISSALGHAITAPPRKLAFQIKLCTYNLIENYLTSRSLQHRLHQEFQARLRLRRSDLQQRVPAGGGLLQEPDQDCQSFGWKMPRQ